MINSILKGVYWNTLSTIFRQVINNVLFIVFARVLSPNDFGLMAIIVVIFNVSLIIQDIGLGASLVKKEVIDKDHINSVFWFEVVAGTLISLLIIVCSPLISSFFEDNLLKNALPLISIFIFMRSFGIVHRFIFQRQMDFKSLAFIETLSTTISGSIGVILVLNNFKVWTLIYRECILIAVNTILMWKLSNWSPEIKFNIGKFKELIRFGINYSLTKVIIEFSQKADDIFIGKILGTQTLGIYSTAYKFLMFPIDSIKAQFFSVFFSSYSKIQNDIHLQQRIYLNSTKVFSFIYFPTVLGILITCKNLVPLILGDKWIMTIPLIEVFCIGSFFTGIGFPGILLLVHSRETLLLKVTLINKSIILLLLTLGIIMYGLIGATYGLAIGFIIETAALNYYGLKVAKIPISSLINSIMSSLIASLLMVMIIYILLQCLNFKSNLHLLIIKVFTGFSFYLTYIIVYKPTLIYDLFVKSINKLFK